MKKFAKGDFVDCIVVARISKDNSTMQFYEAKIMDSDLFCILLVSGGAWPKLGEGLKACLSDDPENGQCFLVNPIREIADGGKLVQFPVRNPD